MNTEFKEILIYGLGLMGASLSLALRKKNFTGRITGIVRSQKSKEQGFTLNVADEIFLEGEFLKKNIWDKYDFIILSLPVDLTCEKIDLIPDSYKGFITDLGSTKQVIIQKVEAKYKNTHNYYSSHPMTGSEQTGLQYANPEMYEKKLCILTKPKLVSDNAVQNITNFWQELGCYITEIDALSHDEILSYLSHGPHILSSVLVKWAEENDKVNTYNRNAPLPLFGGGFRDMTRIAGSNPEMWDAIIRTNPKSIHSSLVDFRDRLNTLIQLMESNMVEGFWKQYFEEAKIARNIILKNGNN